MSERDANGGESNRLAPVIPLFGGDVPGARKATGARETVAPASAHDREAGPADGAESAESAVTAGDWHRTWRDEPRGSFPAAVPPASETDDDAASADSAAKAEASLLRKLRARSLSVQEARTVLGGQGLIRKQADDILAEMVRLGYLDDRVLAEQLVHAGQDRRGQGRQAIAQTLAKRGVPRDVADAALAELPDDDMERALEFARRKAGGIGGRDAHAELRRLAGQLARRGYPSNVALSAARQALDER